MDRIRGGFLLATACYDLDAPVVSSVLDCLFLFLLALDQADQEWQLAFALLFLVLLAGRLFALWVDCDLVGAEEVALGVVGQAVGQRAEV